MNSVEAYDHEAMQQADGDCFQVAAKLATTDCDQLDDVREQDRVRLVHGWVRHQHTGKYYIHAWVEHTRSLTFPHTNPSGEANDVKYDLTVAVDRSNGLDVNLPTAMYYKLGHITQIVSYTPERAMQFMQSTGHFGPWTLEELQP